MSVWSRALLGTLILGWLVACASPAAAEPISAAVAGTFFTVGTTAFAVATFVVNTALYTLASFALNKLFGPKVKAQERQASVLSLSLGEVPREVIVGRAATGGSLITAFNHGGRYGTDKETLVIALADHECDALEGFIVMDKYVPFTGDGAVTGFNGKLTIHWRPGTESQTLPADLRGLAGFDADDNLAGVAHVWVTYEIDDEVWTAGRPSFRWIVRGAKLYDPRKDSTVPGGSGPHRWNDPSTREWSENAYLARYNWVRGFYACNRVDQPSQLLVGRGLSAVEAPPERAIAPANICDEAVALKAGGTEPRYRVGGVIRSDQTAIEVEEMFAAAMAGVIVQPEGGVEIDPGVAKAVTASFTDGDLAKGAPVRFERFQPDSELINTVVARYVEPTQRWQDHAAPVRRSLLDITEDGGPLEEPLSLPLVTSGTQAQRCAEIRRRKARLPRRADVTLDPPFCEIEEGDWVQWTSARFTAGQPVVFRVVSQATDGGFRVRLQLEEISSSVYSWNAATDEITPGSDVPPDLDPDPLEVAGFDVVAVDRNGTPGLRFTWTPAAEIQALVARVRVKGETEIAGGVIYDVSPGEWELYEGVPPNTQVEAQLEPFGRTVGRITAPTAWKEVTTTGDRTMDEINEDLDAAMEGLAEAVSDDVLSPAEKVALLPMIDALVAAKSGLVAQAAALGVTTAKTAYESAMTALESYLATLTDPFDWDDLDGPTDVDGPTLVALVGAARAAETALQDAIGDARRDWTKLTGRPTELTDGRVAAGLDANGDLARNIPASRANSSNLLRRAGGGLFSGDLAATFGADWSTNVQNRPANLAALTGTEQIQNDVLRLSLETGTVIPLVAAGAGTAASLANESPLAQGNSLTPDLVRGRFAGFYANEAAYLAATPGGTGVDGDIYVDESVWPPRLVGRAGGASVEISPTGIITFENNDLDVPSGGLTDVWSVQLPIPMVDTTFFTVQLSLEVQNSPRTTSGSAGVGPSGAYEVWERDPANSAGSQRKVLEGAWGSQTNAPGDPNPTWVVNFTLDGDTGRQAWSESSRERNWLFGGQERLLLRMSSSPALNNAKARLRVYVQRN